MQNACQFAIKALARTQLEHSKDCSRPVVLVLSLGSAFARVVDMGGMQVLTAVYRDCMHMGILDKLWVQHARIAASLLHVVQIALLLCSIISNSDRSKQTQKKSKN